MDVYTMIGMLCFSVGNLFVQQLSTLPTLWPLIGLFSLLCLLGCYWRSRYVYYFCAFVVGFSYTVFHAEKILQWELPSELQGQDIIVQGVISDIPETNNQRTRFIFQVIDADEWAGKPKLLLYWYRSDQVLQVGEQWQLTVRLKRPHGFANPGSFDYERWLFAQQIRATGYVREQESNQRLTSHGYRIEKGRQQLADYLAEGLVDFPIYGMIQALTVGLKAAITQEQWQTLQATGTNHLMAISGLHVGLLASFAYFFCMLGWRCSARLCQWWPAQHAAIIAAMSSAFIYALLAGFAVPTQRAFIMVAVGALALLTRRYISLWQGFVSALVLVILIDPMATLTPGFHLSFAAVALIFYGCTGRGGSQRWWYQSIRAQWCIFIGLMPLTILFFQQVSLVGFFANLIAIPWVGFIVVPLALLGCLLLLVYYPLAIQVLTLAAYALQAIYGVLDYLADLPFARWWHAAPNSYAYWLALLGVCLLLAPKNWFKRCLGVLLILPLFFPYYGKPGQDELWLTLLDVGQGLAVILQTQHHVLMYDTGPKFSDDFNAGSAVVLPYLRQRGIRRINRLVLSHGHYDHIGGMYDVLAMLSVNDIIAGEARGLDGLAFNYCVAGHQWQWDGVEFEFLYPQIPEQWSSNDNSCVLKVSVGDKTILFTGDIERRAEAWLLAHQAHALPADILIVPHHGSQTSSTIPFVAAVDPTYALFSAGYLNRYRLPHPEVMTRYANVKQYVSAKSGAIHFKISNDRMIEPTQHRQTHQRYWHR